jgi:enterochelin esterase-like enzyme
MHVRRWFSIAAVVMTNACSQTFEPRATPLFSTHEAGTVHACAARMREATGPCRLPLPVSTALLERIVATSTPAITGDTVTFAVRAPSVTHISLVGGLRLSLDRVGSTDLWAARVYVPGMSETVISYRLLTETTKAVPRRRAVRGAHAPGPPLRSMTLRGILRTDTLQSIALGMPREVIYYVPRSPAVTGRIDVVYIADGATVRDLAPMLDTLITRGELPPIALVGVRAARTNSSDANGRNDRAREYVYGFDSDSTRYLAHEKFFVEEVSAWAEKTLNVANTRAGRTIWGASNGGAFAVAMGLRHPDRFAHVIAASPVYALIPRAASNGPLPTFTLSAGTLEEVVRGTTASMVATLRNLNARMTFDLFAGGHDDLIWSESFVRTVNDQPESTAK